MDAGKLREVVRVFFLAAIAFGLIAREENGDGVQRGIGEIRQTSRSGVVCRQ